MSSARCSSAASQSRSARERPPGRRGPGGRGAVDGDGRRGRELQPAPRRGPGPDRPAAGVPGIAELDSALEGVGPGTFSSLRVGGQEVQIDSAQKALSLGIGYLSDSDSEFDAVIEQSLARWLMKDSAEEAPSDFVGAARGRPAGELRGHRGHPHVRRHRRRRALRLRSPRRVLGLRPGGQPHLVLIEREKGSCAPPEGGSQIAMRPETALSLWRARARFAVVRSSTR